jgi:putative MATE family efflux protein
MTEDKQNREEESGSIIAGLPREENHGEEILTELQLPIQDTEDASFGDEREEETLFLHQVNQEEESGKVELGQNGMRSSIEVASDGKVHTGKREQSTGKTAMDQKRIEEANKGKKQDTQFPKQVAHEMRSGGENRLLDPSKPMWQALLIFVIPLMFSNILQSIGNTFSSILLGRGLGESALAASSTVFPITFFLISFVIGLGSASSVLIGQAFGSGNRERMKATMGTSLTFAFLLGLLAAVAGNLFTRELLLLIGAPVPLLGEAVPFAHIVFASLPFLFVYINFTTFLRGTGDSKTPFYFLLLNTALTLVLTPTFLFGWFGLPQLGVKGAALSNALAPLISFPLLIAWLRWKNHPLAPDRELLGKLRLDRQIVRLMIKVGLPTSIQMIFVSLSEVAVITFVNRFGTHATAAYGAVTQVINYVQMPAISLGIAAGIFGAQLIGAGRQDQLRKLVRSAVTLNYIIGIVLSGVVLWFSREILSWFLTDPSTLAVAEGLLVIVLWAFVIFGNSMILSGVMRSSGTVLWPTLIGIVSIWGVEVPVAFFLSRTIGLKGIWIAYPVAFLFSLTAQFVYYRFFWVNRTHRRFFDGAEPTA